MQRRQLPVVNRVAPDPSLLSCHCSTVCCTSAAGCRASCFCAHEATSTAASFALPYNASLIVWDLQGNPMQVRIFHWLNYVVKQLLAQLLQRGVFMESNANTSGRGQRRLALG